MTKMMLKIRNDIILVCKKAGCPLKDLKIKFEVYENHIADCLKKENNFISCPLSCG